MGHSFLKRKVAKLLVVSSVAAPEPDPDLWTRLSDPDPSVIKQNW
jgi:hypothetical protein